MQSISDKLFMGSLILLMISVVVSGVGLQFLNWRSQTADEMDGKVDTNSSRKKSALDRQDKSLKRLYRSYLLWIALAGMVASIILSVMENTQK